MKLKILITGAAPRFSAQVKQSLLGPNLLAKQKCNTVHDAQFFARLKLEAAYKNIPLELEWEIRA